MVLGERTLRHVSIVMGKEGECPSDRIGERGEICDLIPSWWMELLKEEVVLRSQEKEARGLYSDIGIVSLRR